MKPKDPDRLLPQHAGRRPSAAGVRPVHAGRHAPCHHRAHVKPGAVLVNMARGALVGTAALDQGILSCAGLDKRRLYSAEEKGGKEGIEAMGILPMANGVAVHDFWKPYHK